MGVININNLEPGMILGANVLDRNGRVLLGSGQELTAKHIRVFKMWGVTEANVAGVEEQEIAAREAADIDPALLQEAEEQVQELFLRAGQEHPAMKELARLAVLRRLQSMRERSHG